VLRQQQEAALRRQKGTQKSSPRALLVAECAGGDLHIAEEKAPLWSSLAWKAVWK